MLGFLKSEPRVFKIHADWDDEASVWVITSDDVPGLITEAATQEEVRLKLKAMIPELLELNGLPPCKEEVPVELLIQSEQRLALGC